MPAALLAPRDIHAKLPPMLLAEQSGSALCDQGGRPLGPRAQNTRVRILDATVELLDKKPMRDLRVIDIARRIGSSPATFYQYVPAIESARAESAAVASLASAGLRDAALDQKGDLVIYPQGDAQGRVTYRLGYRLTVRTTQPAGNWLTIIAAGPFDASVGHRLLLLFDRGPLRTTHDASPTTASAA